MIQDLFCNESREAVVSEALFCEIFWSMRMRWLWFGLKLALDSRVAWVGLALAPVALFFVLGLAITMVRSESGAPVELVSGLASQVLAFGPGMLIAFGVGLEAFSRDRNDGVRPFMLNLGANDRDYVFARVGGVVALLFGVIGGGTFLAGVVGVALAPGADAVGATLQAMAAALVFSLAFSAVFGTIAMATLAPRRKRGGYLAFLLVVALPELVRPVTSLYVPREWAELFSLSKALVTMRHALSPGGLDVWTFLRAGSVAAGATLLASYLARVQVPKSSGALPS